MACLSKESPAGIVSPMQLELSHIRSRWNEVLDLLEKSDRIAWLAFFDARLASYENELLTLDFSDSRKFGTSHEYSETRVKQIALLKTSIFAIFGVTVEIIEL